MDVQKMTATRASLPAAAQYARLGFSILNVLFSICIALQVFLAGLALFVDSSQWGMHGHFAMYFAPIPVLLFILSFPARLPKSMKMKSLVLIGLILLIFATAVFSEEIGFAAAVHPVISLGLFLNALLMMREMTKG
ncbi:hypothetical protein FHS19_003034 [Paenibacillus rhizosphaerae]|uniref:Uncharacterized protein n=1 Tax=Paenibacillus rhizosphaerae TaxID=297318 RepID=A0A839TRU8_9BACL|nr:DUF6220 domain-containing protein [Paenibacillus rhizosphaerae]MBB3128380.1 hypothetical protein [Paenibacillus rhizosphaerae]